MKTTISIMMTALLFAATPASAAWYNPFTWLEDDEPAAPAAPTAPSKSAVIPASAASDTIEVAGKDFYSIGTVGGAQNYVLKLKATDGREFRFDGDVTAVVASTVNVGDLVEIKPDNFRVLDRLRQMIPKGPIFMTYVEGVAEYHPAILGSRGVTATIIAACPIDVSITAACDTSRIEVIGIDEPGFTKFLENIQAAGAWVRLRPVGRNGGGPSDRFAAAVAKAWGIQPNDFPRVVHDDLGRRVIQTVWPEGISVVSLRQYDLTGFPRKPERGTISPDGIINPGDVAPLNRARKFRGHEVDSAEAIDSRIDRIEKQATAKRQAAQKAAHRAAAAKKAKAKADSVKAAEDDSLKEVFREKEDIKNMMLDAQAAADRAEKEARFQQAAYRVKLAASKKKLTQPEAVSVNEAIVILRNLDPADRPMPYPTEEEFKEARKKADKALK